MPNIPYFILHVCVSFFLRNVATDCPNSQLQVEKLLRLFFPYPRDCRDNLRWMTWPSNFAVNTEQKPIEQSKGPYFLCNLICGFSCFVGGTKMNILLTMCCQLICLPILYNILKKSDINWEIWVYITLSVWYFFSLYYILFYIIHIFVCKLFVTYLNSHIFCLQFVKTQNIFSNW